jgi:hypothetical protein
MNRFQSEMGVIQRMNRPLQSVNREHSETEWSAFRVEWEILREMNEPLSE